MKWQAEMPDVTEAPDVKEDVLLRPLDQEGSGLGRTDGRDFLVPPLVGAGQGLPMPPPSPRLLSSSLFSLGLFVLSPCHPVFSLSCSHPVVPCNRYRVDIWRSEFQSGFLVSYVLWVDIGRAQCVHYR